VTLSEHFIELAARLRRIDHRDPRKAQQEIDSAAAWGAKLVRHASDAGHLDLTTICTDPESLWPAETGFPTAATAEAWRNLWLVFATFLCRLYPHRLPPDVCGSVFSEREPGVYDLRVHTSEWRIRAEGYALIAEFLAENSAAGEVNGPPGEPPRSADNAEPRPAYGRDHLFLEWSEQGLKPAAIRDRWNALSDDERKALCPARWAQIGDEGLEAGRDAVKKALRAAIRDRAF